MTVESNAVPGYFELTWLLFFVPARWKARLESSGLPQEECSAWRLWRQPGPGREARRTYVFRLLALTLILTLLAALIIDCSRLFFARLPGLSSWDNVVVLLILFPIFSFVFPVRFLAIGTVSFLVGFYLSFVLLEAVESLAEIRLSAEFGFALMIGLGLFFSGLGAYLTSLGSTITFAVLIYAFVYVAGYFDEGMGDPSLAAAIASLFVICITRLPLYPLEAVYQALLYGAECFLHIPTLRLVPVRFHQISFLRHPFLEAHLLRNAARRPELVRQVLEACALAPGQQGVVPKVLTRLQAQELTSLAERNAFQQAERLESEWLPGEYGADEVLMSFRQAARFVVAADGTSVTEFRLDHLTQAERILQGLENTLLRKRSWEAAAFAMPLRVWLASIGGRRQATPAAARQRIHIPFRFGAALTPKHGRELFRGREGVVHEIESRLVNQEESCSIVLLAPRGCGKTSLLNMLPELLPDTVCIFFDLQANPVDSVRAFFEQLAKVAQSQADRNHGLALPALPPGLPFQAANQWLQALEETPLKSHSRILICLDEFENLAHLFPGTGSDFIKLMGLFRATIQHRRKVRLLVSGASSFSELGELRHQSGSAPASLLEELGAIWNEHFLNAHQVCFDYLDKPTSQDLLMRPSADFPDNTIPLSAAEAIFERTGGHPFLLQTYGYYLAAHLNEEQRATAEVGDVAIVEDKVLSQRGPFFRDILRALPHEVSKSLEAIALGTGMQLTEPSRRWLRRRRLLTSNDELALPVLGEWLREL